MNKTSVFGIFLISVLAFFLLAGCLQQPPPGGAMENKSNVTQPPAPPPPPAKNDTPMPNPNVTNVTPPSNETPQNATYEPKVNPADFVSGITNRYFSLTPGKKLVYEGETEEGTERNEVYVTSDTKIVMGINAMVVWDRVWLEGELIEDTKDWFAQDKYGNVWYLGEDSKELVDGKVVSTEGSWEAGVYGAKPGIIMKANPAVGDAYRQEYYADVAEDEGMVVSLNESVSVPAGNFGNCLKTQDWTRLEPGVVEFKYYCTAVGGVVLEVPEGGRMELLSWEYSAQPSPSAPEPPGELKTNITEEEAIEIALKEVPGKVTDVAIEKKFGRVAYVIEIDADDGPETDVIIDIETGEILGVET